jgi:hypothetical protein
MMTRCKIDSMHCVACGRQPIVVGVLCALCLGVIIPAPSAAASGVSRTAAAVTRPVPGRATEHDQPEQPHTLELEATHFRGGPETEVTEEHVLVLDHPRYGLLNGRNHLGYCDNCPIGLGGNGGLCHGPCPCPGESE